MPSRPRIERGFGTRPLFIPKSAREKEYERPARFVRSCGWSTRPGPTHPLTVFVACR